jgi:hypothetical protein
MGCADFVIQLLKNNGTVSGRSKTMFTSLVVDFERNFSSPRIDKIPRLGDPSLTLLTRRIKDGGDRSLSTSREHAISRVGDLLPSTTSRGPRREGPLQRACCHRDDSTNPAPRTSQMSQIMGRKHLESTVQFRTAESASLHNTKSPTTRCFWRTGVPARYLANEQ